MIIGIDMLDSEPFRQLVQLGSSEYIKLSNMVADELHLKVVADEPSSEKEGWTLGTILHAKFNGDLEAGNITMREQPIEKLRIKRRNLTKKDFIVLNELPFNPEPTQVIYDDYTPSSDENYEYIITPVDVTGIEGIITSTNINPKFDGWWILDLDNPEEHNFQFLYNLDDVNVSIDQDRTELSTFSKYPKVYYGIKRARKGSLSGLFLPENTSVRKQVDKLEEMLALRKPFLLKDGYGRNFIVDVSQSGEQLLVKGNGLSKVTLQWTEVGEYID